MVTDGNYIYHGDHFEMYRNIESLCCIPGTDIVLHIKYNLKATNNLMEEEIRFVVIGDSGGEGEVGIG